MSSSFCGGRNVYWMSVVGFFYLKNFPNRQRLGQKIAHDYYRSLSSLSYDIRGCDDEKFRSCYANLDAFVAC